MIEYAMTVMAIMYPMNVIIYFYLQGEDDSKEVSFFNMLRKKGISKEKFMSFFSGLIFKGGFITSIIGIIYLMRLWLW